MTIATVCTGRSPFRKPAGPATLHAVAYDEPVRSERLGPLRPVVEALLRKPPADRPSAAAVGSELRRVVAGEADTVTGVRQASAAHEGLTRTAWDATSPELAPRRSSRSAGRKRLWRGLATTVVVAAGVVGGLFLSGAPPCKEGPQTTTVRKVVRSAAGWQSVTGVSVQRGDRVTVRFVSGKWTADYRNMPLTGPVGVDARTDEAFRFADSCKLKSTARFAALIAVLDGVKNAPAQTVGRELSFRAAGNGTLRLGMNDTAGSCSADNRGELTIRVSVVHAP
ncbi:hypothetical protein ACGF3G_35095 [Streptomyces sp. NPDC048179]|uniref:hypothetical protein n=1 Tax=Streptomyces sp. NPDC048179 TaxID=3365506 RepID=UPI003722EED4